MGGSSAAFAGPGAPPTAMTVYPLGTLAPGATSLPGDLAASSGPGLAAAYAASNSASMAAFFAASSFALASAKVLDSASAAVHFSSNCSSVRFSLSPSLSRYLLTAIFDRSRGWSTPFLYLPVGSQSLNG